MQTSMTLALQELWASNLLTMSYDEDGYPVEDEWASDLDDDDDNEDDYEDFDDLEEDEDDDWG